MNERSNEYDEWSERAREAIEKIESEYEWRFTPGARGLLVDLLVIAAVETRPQPNSEIYGTRMTPVFDHEEASDALFQESEALIREQIEILSSGDETDRTISGVGVFRIITDDGQRWFDKCPGPY